MKKQNKKILLGVTGSVAASLTNKLYKTLLKDGYDVVVVATKQSFYFFNEKDIDTKIMKDIDEWPSKKYVKGGIVQHIELSNWADIFLIAPLTANTLAKINYGFCDNLLTTIFRAWDLQKPVVLVPAMNTAMWEKKITSKQIENLKLNYKKISVVDPISKNLACGVSGIGAMAKIDDILKVVKNK